MEENTKITLYIDVDDTVLRSSEAIINILNKRHSINPPKTLANLKDWEYRSIYKGITPDEIVKIYESDEFFNTAKIEKEFLTFYRKSLTKVNFKFVTKGTETNLAKKERFLRKHLGNDFEYIGIPFKIDVDGNIENSFSKHTVNMKYGIQIDDRVDCLEKTNAPVKILIQNYGEKHWNQNYANISNLYVVNGWDQAIEIIEFAYVEHYLFKK